MYIAIGCLIKGERSLSAVVVVCWGSEATFGHGSQVVEHADGHVVNPRIICSDIGDSEELISEVFDGVESVWGEAVVLVDEGITGKTM